MSQEPIAGDSGPALLGRATGVERGGKARGLATLGATDVEVWRAQLDQQPDDVVKVLTALLSRDEAARALRFYFDRDRRRFIVARGVLRILLGRYLRCEPREISFCYGPHGKPSLESLEGKPPLFFNVAHSEGLALYAFTCVGEVGIDLERIREIPDWEAIAQMSFSPHELARLRATPAEQQRDEFFRAWTRQEAILKAFGTGLTTTPASAAAAAGAFSVHPLDAGPGFAAALAASPALGPPGEVLGSGGGDAVRVRRKQGRPGTISDFELPSH